MGQLANFHLMDTWQYRDDQLFGDGWKKNVAGRLAGDRTVTQAWVDANVRNVVVLTGDVHRNWANDVNVDYKDPACGGVGTGVHIHHRRGQRLRVHHRSGDGMEPAPEVLQRQPRLRVHKDHQGCYDR